MEYELVERHLLKRQYIHWEPILNNRSTATVYHSRSIKFVGNLEPPFLRKKLSRCKLEGEHQIIGFSGIK